MSLTHFYAWPILLSLFWLTATGMAAAEENPGRQQLSLADLRTFTDVFEQIRRNYVEEIDDRTLLDAAIRGMLSETDAYSVFMTPKEFEALEESAQGEFGWIGAEIIIGNQHLELHSVRPGGPAEQAGLRPGDRILAVDGQTASGDGLEDLFALLRGKPETRVRLSVQPPSGDARELWLTREKSTLISVEGERLERGIAYLKVLRFHDGTPAEFQQRLSDMQAGTEALSGLVIDLRGNLGGQVEAAVAVADGLMNDGLIVKTVSRYPNTRLEFHSHEGTWIPDIPVAVLVDDSTASASEVLSGALQDQHRATIIGQRTFGKGVIQSVMHLRNGSALKLTTAHYLTPAGRSLQGTGVEPDIETGADEDALARALSWLETGN